MPIGQLLGYTKVEGEEDKWLDANEKPATGILAAIAGLTVSDLNDSGELSKAIKTVKLGDAMGYEYDADNEVWKNNGAAVTGILGALADSPISQIDTDVKELPIGTLLGYTQNESGTWLDDDKEPVKGVMKALADCKADEIEDKLNTIEVGTLLGFTPVYDEDDDTKIIGWKNGNEDVDGLLKTVADTTVENLPDIMDVTTLKVSDVFAEDERTGVLGIIDPETTINQVPTEALNCTLNELADAGIIQPIDSTKMAAISATTGVPVAQLLDKPLIDLMNLLFGKNQDN